MSPTALLVAAVYLGSARPRLTGAFYLAGAVVMSLVMAVVILVVLRGVGLNQPRERTPRYGLRLGLGVLRWSRARRGGEAQAPAARPGARRTQGFMSRLVANPAPLSAFLVGLLVFAPGVTLPRRGAGDRHGPGQHRAHGHRRGIVVVINVLLVWLPIVLHLLAPGRPRRAI